MSLPFLDAMRPAFARTAAPAKPRRMLGICNNLGLLPDQFFPQQTGRGYALSPYLETLRAHREDFSVFSGVWHPDVDAGHPADICFLTAAPRPGSGGFRNTISLDQFIAERIGHETRFPSLTLGVNVQQGQRSLSWTASGVLIPCEEKASDVFRRLFVQGSPAEVEAQVRRLAQGRSILDAVGGQARDLQRSVGARTGTGSTNTSPASASWSSGYRRRASGSTGRSHAWRPPCPSIRPAPRPIWIR